MPQLSEQFFDDIESVVKDQSSTRQCKTDIHADLANLTTEGEGYVHAIPDVVKHSFKQKLLGILQTQKLPQAYKNKLHQIIRNIDAIAADELYEVIAKVRNKLAENLKSLQKDTDEKIALVQGRIGRKMHGGLIRMVLQKVREGSPESIDEKLNGATNHERRLIGSALLEAYPSNAGVARNYFIWICSDKNSPHEDQQKAFEIFKEHPDAENLKLFVDLSIKLGCLDDGIPAIKNTLRSIKNTRDLVDICYAIKDTNDEEMLEVALKSLLPKTEESRPASRIFAILAKRTGNKRHIEKALSIMEKIKKDGLHEAILFTALARHAKDRERMSEGVKTLKPFVHENNFATTTYAAAVHKLGDRSESETAIASLEKMIDEDLAILCVYSMIARDLRDEARMEIAYRKLEKRLDDRLCLIEYTLLSLALDKIHGKHRALTELVKFENDPVLTRLASRVEGATEIYP